MFLTFLSKNFFNSSKVSLIVMLYGASIDTGIDIKNFFDTLKSLVVSYIDVKKCSYLLAQKCTREVTKL